jgi:steroid delta-isomerase-like uncharacterized protein
MAVTDPKSQSELINETFTEAYNTGETDLIDDVCAAEFVVYHSAYEEPIQGIESFKEHIETIRTGFPDFEMENVETLYDGEKSAGLYRWTGTHEGEFREMPATGKQVTVEAMSIGTLDDDGKMKELRIIGSDLSMMRQLGVLPE